MTDAKDPTYIDQYVSKRLRQRRDELELSQEELADKLGVTYQQFQKYESGRNRISAGRLYELSRVLETTISYFYQGVDTLGSAYGRGVAEEAGDFTGPVDSEAVDLMVAFKAIRDSGQRKSLLAAAKKSAAVSSPPKGGRAKRKR